MAKTENRLAKKMAAIGFSLAITFSGSLAVKPRAAQAETAASSSTAEDVIATGKRFLGTPYQFGAQSGDTSEFDCSSFVQYVFGQHGIDLPRSSRQQAKEGDTVPEDQLQPGDLVFSDTNRDGKINHVSIYIGDQKLLHTYRKGIGVTISDYEGSIWEETFVDARRVLPDSGQDSASPQEKPERNKEEKAATVEPEPYKQTEPIWDWYYYFYR
jgi:cell wall-associated NlpC family hydrolase